MFKSELAECVNLFNSGKVLDAEINAKLLANKYSNEYELFNLLALISVNLNKFDQAILYFNSCLKLNNNSPDIFFNLGLIYRKKNNFFLSIKNYKKAIKLKKDFLGAYVNLAAVCKLNGSFEEAIENYKQAIKLKPDYLEVYNNLGIIYGEIRRFKEALVCFKKIKMINKKFYDAYYNESFIFLLQSKFKKGFDLHEYRWKATSRPQDPYYDLNNKLWDGKPFKGTLLVWSEQGLGDHLFFGRMVCRLNDYAKKIIFKVDKRLVQLFRDFLFKPRFNNIEVVAHEINNPIVIFDKHIPSGSLGKFFANNNKEILKFSRKSFVLNNKINEKKIITFLSNFKGLKIGLSWKSLNKNEQHRNIPLEKLTSVFNKKNLNLINLQFGETNQEISEINKNLGIKIHNLREVDNLNDISELCFLINHLDLVITIQNTTAHLSLGLQKKTYVLLPLNSRWHWGVNKKRSNWYPAAEIFRQSRHNYWEDVLNNVKIQLNKDYYETI